MATQVTPTYLLDSGGNLRQLFCTNLGVAESNKASGNFIPQTVFLNDTASSQVWQITLTLESSGNAAVTATEVPGPCSPTQLLVNSPNGSLWAIQVTNGVVNTVTGSACVYSFLQLRNELANRLNDPQKVFWTDAELGVQIQNALRFWNVLTGDNKQWFSLAVEPGTVWYDFQQMVNGPRQSYLTDANLYSWLQYALLEPQQPNAVLLTKQYSTDDLVQAVQRKRDEFLFKSRCTSVVEPLNVQPNNRTVALPVTVIQVMRAYFLPAAGGGWPLPRGDEWTSTAYDVDLTPGDPETFSAGIEPPLTMELDPAPDQPGIVECLTVESQKTLQAGCPSILYIPSDFVPGLLWGALADLMGSAMEKSDQARANYARSRYDQFVELINNYPFVLAARVTSQALGLAPLFVDAVEVLDIWENNWRTQEANPSVVGLSGQNLVAFPTAQAMNISLLLVANTAVPVNDGDCILLGREIIDAILDYAEHTSLFKCGGAEFLESMALFKNIIELASQRNNKIKAMSTFRDLLYGRAQREDVFAAKEATADNG
jgi:hypothetical protein